MAIRVGNVRDYIRGGKVVLPENAVYVGRRVNRYALKGSPLGSPWHVGKCYVYGRPYLMFDGREVDVPRGFLTPEDVVSLTRLSLQQSIGMKEQPVLDELDRLRALAAQGDLLLLCWCETWDGTGEPPGKCHAEILKEYLEAER